MPGEIEQKNGTGAAFEPTHWSVVLAARNTQSPAATESLEALCRTYWYPLYAHVRRRGRDHHTAQDLTQEFFARLVEKNWLAAVKPEKGRFRTFLLASMDHLLANDWRDARAAKRGGASLPISLEDCAAGEERFTRELPTGDAVERQFDRAWATVVLERALARLQQEFIARNKANQFQDWKLFLSREATNAACGESGRRLRMSASAVSVAVHRMRERYGVLLRETVAQTMADPSDTEEELQYLFTLLSETL
jgi:RNA polymerase sigma-70 factor (ECF subfamily)